MARTTLPFGYTTLGPIAQGAFSQVVRARNLESGALVAVKSCATAMKAGGKRIDEGALKGLRSEMECLEKLRESNHQHVANMIGKHESKYEVHIILHYCSGGTLHRLLQSQGYGAGGLDEGFSVNIFSQVGAALAHLHHHGVTHRDLKPAMSSLTILISVL